MQRNSIDQNPNVVTGYSIVEYEIICKIQLLFRFLSNKQVAIRRQKICHL